MGRGARNICKDGRNHFRDSVHCKLCAKHKNRIQSDYRVKGQAGCGGSNTNKTVCNSLLKLMTVSAQSGFNSLEFNNSMCRYRPKMSIYPQPFLMKWDIVVEKAAFYEAHRLTRFHKRGPFDMAHVTV
ncbi:hypothetical protein CAPTEDRAFT_198173 [Capitella teleta]|uniref:Uncharacterized protein n=1 Tax=Capitella teleta TaxID=283909 RepID=X1ZYC6_CAPTE|nr:hypothetical protein CAPTEDRAFT_198173 [Capitella teleta]|eukprot:ELU04718.1 hypothetical protein CAPTEDRAFT_198173 [Capitella teleta]